MNFSFFFYQVLYNIPPNNHVIVLYNKGVIIKKCGRIILKDCPVNVGAKEHLCFIKSERK